MDTRPPKQNFIFHFISAHPFGVCVAFLGAVASIVALILGVFPWLTAPHRHLVYRINPVRTPIVQTTAPSDVSILYKGKPVSGNVTAVQIAIWNAGREPIKSEDILRNIVIQVGTNQIMEAKIVKSSREVCEFQFDSNKVAFSSMGVTWRILEKNDGASVQLVYSGTPDVKVSVEGTIVGERVVKELTGSATYLFTFRLPISMTIATFLLGGVSQFLILMWVASRKQTQVYQSIILLILVLLGTLVCLVGIINNYSLLANHPPFGF